MERRPPPGASTIRREAAQDRVDIRTECAGVMDCALSRVLPGEVRTLIATGPLMLARHDTGGVVRLCKPASDLELPLTVLTDLYAATDEPRAIKVNPRS